MNEQTPPDLNIPVTPVPTGEIKPEVKSNNITQLKNSILTNVKAVGTKFRQSKFYANKKVFWPITIGFGLIFLTLIIGLLFGNRKMSSVSVKSTPTPTPQGQNEVIKENGDILFQTEQKLKDLKNQITTFDTKQSRLKSPTLNYDVKF